MGLLVLVAMMEVRVVRMPVPEPVMPMPVRMRLGRRPLVDVLMMLVVDMPVFVFDRLVRMVMLVAFGQMQPDAERHKRAGDDQLNRDWLAQEHDRDDRSNERREREIGRRPGAAEMTQRPHKQYETNPDAEEPNHQGGAHRAE